MTRRVRRARTSTAAGLLAGALFFAAACPAAGTALYVRSFTPAALLPAPLPAPGVRIPLTALPSGPSPHFSGGIPSLPNTNQIGTNADGTPIYSPVVVSGSFKTYAPNAPLVVAGQFNPYQVAANPNGTVTGTITQTDNAGILQWSTFDIGANATVNILQPSSTALLLNRISGGAFNNSTVIEGMLNANGQVYIYNPNGIVFGKTSQINVNSLVASTLNISNDRFLAGILQPSLNPILAAEVDSIGRLVLSGGPGGIVVEGESVGGIVQQAQLVAANGGKILLAAPNIRNNGLLIAPDGQVVLAAGGKVYLASPNDLNMRGLVVEVNNDLGYNDGTGAHAVTSDSTATNDKLGKILVGRGNASMVGLAVNQDGVVSANTSVTLNGSIWLHARDGASKSGVTEMPRASNGGALELGADSRTEVLPTLDDPTTISGTTYTPSSVDLSGNTIHLVGNASVKAPGGNVDVYASAHGESITKVPTPNASSRVYLDPGASIDVSGTTSTQLAMESNVIQVQLRGNELADDVLQRNSVVRGKTVSIDIRKGTPLANVQGYLDLVQHIIGEYTATGGNVTFRSDGDIIMRRGAKVNVSGGYLTYLPGYVATTQLTSMGHVFDIGSASPNLIYDGVLAPKPEPRNFQPGYVRGMNAGSIRFDAPTVVLAGKPGDLAGSVSAGTLQRDVAGTSRPQGGELVIGRDAYDPSNPTAVAYFDGSAVVFAGKVKIGGTATAGLETPAFADRWAALDATQRLLQTELDLDPLVLNQGGFSRLRVYTGTGGAIDVGSPLTLAAGGQITLSAQENVSIAAPITVPGGKVALASQANLVVSDGVKVDVAGTWTNDMVTSALDAQGLPTTPIIKEGGSISVSGLNTSIGSGASFDVSGGAWLDSSGKLASGNGGNISVGPPVSGGVVPTDVGLTLGEGVVFSGYGIDTGGTMKMSARNISLGQGWVVSLSAHNVGLISPPVPAGDLSLPASWFQQGGFSLYDIRAAGNLDVISGPTIMPRMDTWFATRNTKNTASGPMNSAFTTGRLPLGGAAGSRGAASLSLTAAAETRDGAGRLNVQTGAQIELDPGGSVKLSAGRQLTVAGSIAAPGGSIALLLTPDVAANGFYRPERSIWVGSSASIDAGGSAARLWQDSRGLTRGNLLAGGSIRIGRYDAQNTLVAAPGYVVVKPGALFNVSGVVSPMTLSTGNRGARTADIASPGGSIDVHAREGLLFYGDLMGAGGNSTAMGGSLAMSLDRELTSVPLAGFPSGPLDLSVAGKAPAANTPGAIPTGLKPDQSLSGVAGQGVVLASAINQGGFDWVTLKSEDTLTFQVAGNGNNSASLMLNARDGLLIDAPGIKAATSGGVTSESTLTLAAPYVRLGNSDWLHQNAPAAVADKTTLVVNAGDTIDLIGQSALIGFDQAKFNAAADIRFTGVVPGVDLTVVLKASSLPALHAIGALSIEGDMSFTSAQLYPTSLSSFSLLATGSAGNVTFSGNGNAAAMPLSAAGTLSVRARNIVQDGTVRAPLGEISFTATDSLRFSAGSLTSVAGSGTVPLGFVQNGREWLYDFGAGNVIDLSNSAVTNYVALPGKAIVSNAPKVTLAAGAVQNLSGGGDLYAYEFTPGPGGSKDVLAIVGSGAAKVFAVVPGFNGQIAPQDFQYGQNSGLKPGDRVYLSGVDGLPGGYYTLLPAHYALLPGAYAITALPGSTDASPTGNYQDLVGNLLIAGYRASIGGGRDNRWSRFEVIPASLVRNESEFADYPGNAFLSGKVTTLPRDGGHVVFNVTKALSLGGQVLLGGANAGQNGIADISATDIAVVSDSTQSLPAESDPAAAELTVAQLTALGADSLLLGGVRDRQSDGDHVTVSARQVVVANNAAHPLSGPEIILVAGSSESKDGSGNVIGAGTLANNGSILVKAGSAILAQGSMTGKPRNLLLQDQPNLKLLGADGALLRVSSGAAVSLQRGTTQADGSTLAPARLLGSLEVQAGATVSGTGSMMFDATASTVIAAALAPRAGAALSFGGNRVSFGSASPTGVPGLRFDDSAIQALNGFASLAFTSYSTIDLWGPVNLGSSTMTALSLSAAGIQAYANPNDPRLFPPPPSATLTAGNVNFTGLGSFVLAAPDPGNAADKLTVNAQNIQIGGGAFAVHGYTTTTLNAGSEIRTAGQGGMFSADSALTLATGRISADSGTDTTIAAGRQLTLTQASNAGGAAAGTPAPLQFGGKLSFQGLAIVSDANIAAPAGQVNLAANRGIFINGGTISVAGASETFGSTVAYAPGGQIAMDGGAGNIVVGSNATLDVSATGASAGALSLKAVNGNNGVYGQASLDGTLKGAAAAGMDGVLPTQGSFAMEVDQLDSTAGFGALNAKLNAGGFTESRGFHIRQGDVVLGAGDTITAHQVTLATDKGGISIAGTIDASGAAGGSISLYAAEAHRGNGTGNVTIQSGAQLNASATVAATGAAGSVGRGGSIMIGTSTGDGTEPGGGEATVSLNSGAALDVSGKGQGLGGSISLRAPRLTQTSDLAPIAANSPITAISSTTANTYLVSNPAVKALTPGTVVAFTVNQDNTGASSLDLSGFGATDFGSKPLLDSTGQPVAGGDLRLGEVVVAVYDGSSFKIRETSNTNIYLISNPAITVLTPGTVVTFRVDQASLGATALDITGARTTNLGMTPLVKYGGQALANGDLVQGETVVAVYDGTRFEISSATPAGVQSPNAGTRVAVAPIASTIVGTSTVAVEAAKVYNNNAANVTIDANTLAQWRSDNLAFMANAATITNSLKSANPLLSVSLQPGIELRNSGDINLATSIDFSSKNGAVWDWRYGTAKTPGVLTLRAGGNLILKSSISDGFIANGNAMPDWSPDISGVASWSYRLIGGANLSGANPLTTTPGTVSGDVILSFGATSGSGAASPVSLVRTGTGSVSLAAGRDVILDTLDVSTHTRLVFDNRDSNGNWTLPNANSYSADTLVGATIYTTGLATPVQAGFAAPVNNLNCAYSSAGCSGRSASTNIAAAFTSGGGAIDIAAQRNVMGSITTQMTNNWLFRQGNTTTNGSGDVTFAQVLVGANRDGTGGTSIPQNTAWWSRFDYFNQGLATFGGGNISVVAASGDVSDIAASVATNAYVPGTTPVGASLFEQGGGNLMVRAGGDIRGGTYYVQKGSGVLRANSSITVGDRMVQNLSTSTLVALNPVLAVGDATFDLIAGRNLRLEAAFNPMMTPQSSNQSSNGAGNTVKPTIPSKLPDQFSTYSTYGANSAVRLTAVSGDLLLSENADVMFASGGADILNYTSDPAFYNGAKNFYLLQPGSLVAAALSGDITFQHGFSLWPSASGQLELLAKGNVSSQFPVNASGNSIDVLQQIVMIDRDPATMSTTLLPRGIDQTDVYTVTGAAFSGGAAYHTAGGLHANDPEPVRVIALQGDVNFGGNLFAATINVPKAAEIIAGHDVIDVGFDVQQLAASDVTLVKAGHDIYDKTISSGLSPVNLTSHFISGPGRIDFVAGRNFDLGNAYGVVTRGNLDNPYLPATGASINIVAGAAPSYSTFSTAQIGFSNLVAADYPALVAYLGQLQPAVREGLVAYLRQQNPNLVPDLNWAGALADFGQLGSQQQASFAGPLWTNNFVALSTEQQADFLFFRQAIDATSDPVLPLNAAITRLDNLIGKLFPATAAASTGGDINLFGSQLKTDRGGSINLFSPNGSVYAGLVSLPAYLKNKSASDLGVFTIGGGVLQALVKKDFLVNQGRVFTLGGGDITLVSQYGNIDAGKGAKTAQSTPPPLLTTDANGNIQVDISGSISGSGIATLSAGPDVPASNVYPIAPRGIFDAGDAGVRSTGSVNIIAAVVLNANNITAAGTISGSHVAATSAVASPAAAPGSAPPPKTDNIAGTAAPDPTTSLTLTVDLLGYGGADNGQDNNGQDNGQQNVTEDSQNAASDESSNESSDERKKKKKKPDPK